MTARQNQFPLATAMRESFKKGYGFKKLRKDCLAGLVVSLVALPLAMALSIAVGLPPQHGLYTAIVAGFVAALLGGSMNNVSGPTAAFVVIVAPIVAEHGLHGLVWCQIMAGLMLLIMGFMGLGRYIHYVPYSVTTGFTAGIAIVIATLGLNDFLGLGLKTLQGDYLDKAFMIISHLPDFNPYELTVGCLSLIFMMLTNRLVPKLPAPIFGIILGTALAYALESMGHPVATIASRFTFTDVTGIHHGISNAPPLFYSPTLEGGHLLSLPFFDEWKILLMPALVVALLSALESLLTGTVADQMAGTRLNPNSELNGIGVANILTAFVGGIPATGAIARTVTGINAGAQSPIAAIIHAVLMLTYVICLAPLINHVPMAALSALLMVTAYRMSHIKEIINAFKQHRDSDLIVLLTCLLLTVFVDMVAGVVVGFLMASLLFMRRIANITTVELEQGICEDEEGETIQLPQHVMLFKIDGPLFFGTVEKAFDRYQFIHDHIKTVIIDLERVPLIDLTGIVSLKSMLKKMIGDGKKVIICGNSTLTENMMKKVITPEMASHIRVAETVEDALI
ncbi:MAG: STAS domain-containing protein [Alphaproteobacteria bacterium]|nr:STAS domain-containing protein [Alphaproteobacteria bacterium]